MTRIFLRGCGTPQNFSSNFSFLSKYGKVFQVFDDQDSGNICFGIANGEDRLFVKFAGAPTERSNITQNEAIERMKSTVQIYKDLEHPILANLINTEEIGGGLATAFALFGDNERRDRRIEDWKLSKELYGVAKKAVSDERNERQQSIEQFIVEWRAAK